MAWIESHDELPGHGKTKKAARLLGISIPQVIGHLHCLWYWALTYAEDGDLTGRDPQDIADGAMWEGDCQVFIDALLECNIKPGGAGFLEHNGDTLLIHDWMDYAGRLIVKRRANRDRAHEAYVQSMRSLRAEDTQSARPPYQTVPNQTEPTVPNQPLTSFAGANDGVITPPKPIPKLEAPKPEGEESERPSYTAGQRLFLDKLDRKRFATRVQAQAVADLEREVGFEVLERALMWAAKNNIRMFSSIETTARKMASGGTKTGPSPPDRSGNTIVREAVGMTAPSLRELEESGRLRGGFFAKQAVVKQEVGE